ncbi:ATP-grasp domain-containing protein [Polaribacter sp. KT 15]|uniref:carboxylate--amine ligase n=1 Tax=Polaribacter sp. KT 15 TaxID=1896175 RepID=UPI00090997CB|nr:ATP-grasp domain-containing protein [Polaribacter sp. KT 15]SHN01008.1 Carbamoyl-phosphate synthase L chain, ATP binding domain [Polaribacter sp. KT 15]
MKKRVLLLDGQTIQSLAIAKALKKNNYNVVLFCDTKTSYGYRTRYADAKVICPSVITNPVEFKSFLIEYLKENIIDVVIPMNDFSASFLSSNKLELLKFTKFIIPDITIFNSGYDKNQLMQICEQHNFPHPKSADLDKVALDVASEKVGFPSLIKPNITTGGRGITLVNSKEELFRIYNSIKEEHGSCHLQQFIKEGGKQFKVQLFVDDKGELLASSVIDKIRFYPEKGGSSCCNKTIEDKSLVNLCYDVLKTIGWVGFADFDLIQDPKTGESKIMEINPRVPACIKSSIVSGIDFATIIANQTLGLELKNYIYSPNKYLRYFGLDILWFLFSQNRFKTDPNWFKLLSKNTYYQEGSLDDIMPFIYGTVGGFLKQLNPTFRKNKSGMR